MISGPGRPGREADLVLIEVESLGANVIDLEYQGRPVMPFLKKLSAEAIYYPYVLSYRAAGGTSDCEYAVINGREPLAGAPIFKIEDRFSNSLVKELRKAGYSAQAFHGNSGEFYNRNSAFRRMGFQEFWTARA